jgi:hypothetical protein
MNLLHYNYPNHRIMEMFYVKYKLLKRDLHSYCPTEKEIYGIALYFHFSVIFILRRGK